MGILAVAYKAYVPDFSHYALPKDYKMPYGKDPFAPSMAKTVSGGPVAPQLLAGSESCGASGCHTEIYKEWEADSHRWSSEDVAFQGVQGALIHAEGHLYSMRDLASLSREERSRIMINRIIF